MIGKGITFESEGTKLAGVLRTPDDMDGRSPGVLLVHGSLEQDRDGNLLEKRDGRPAFKKNFFIEISKNLCGAGFAAFSWDRRGIGESEGSWLDCDTMATIKDVKAALDCLCSQDDIDPDRIAVLGQSAGVYHACLLAGDLLAKGDPRPKVFVLQGGLCRNYSEMMAYNYRRLVDYAGRSPENLRWIGEEDLFGLMIGIHLSEIEERAKKGWTDHDLTYKGKTWRYHYDPMAYAEEYSPIRQFRHIKRPALIIHGACDLNVPVEDASMILKELKANGRDDMEYIIIPDADHSFQMVAGDEDTRLRERITLDSFRRPYRREYFDALKGFLKRRL
ncbi:MAG: alpha/beta hydrolase family protein [Methanotrichaceae archaeon]